MNGSRFPRLFAALPLLMAIASACAEAPPLLKDALGGWVSGQQDWAFVRRTRTLDGKGDVRDDRVEAYDPSQPDDKRWRLLEVNGKSPGDEDLAREAKKNGKARRYGGEPPAELLDLDRAEIRRESAREVVYEVPVRRVAAGLVQTNKLLVLITVDRSSRQVQRLAAQLRGQMRIALGLAKITDVDLDLTFEKDRRAAPADPLPTTGTAKATLNWWGERMEYDWYDFKVVTAFKPSPGI